MGDAKFFNNATTLHAVDVLDLGLAGSGLPATVSSARMS